MADLSNITKFYKKRAIGILPMYYIAAIVCVLLICEETVLQNLVLAPVEVLGIQSVFSSLFSFSHNGGTWFVSCILLCYLVFPFIQNCVKQIKNNKTKIALLLISIGILLYAPIVIWVFEISGIYSNPFFRMLEFIIGVIIASILAENKNNSFLSKILLNKIAIIIELIILIIGITMAYKLGISPGNYMLYSWIALPIFCLMLPALAYTEWGFLDDSKIIRYMSKLSYAYFFAQFFVWSMIKYMAIENNILRIICVNAFCFCIAVVLDLSVTLLLKLIRIINKKSSV